ncbi:hypothetical protein ABMA28_013821 [Loxostege sticticalis]|uniref:Gag protein n=1 Tax=Loxostege sticticalis TaxID=481309 RepID=A0ABD0TJN2_LOXSC
MSKRSSSEQIEILQPKTKILQLKEKEEMNRSRFSYFLSSNTDCSQPEISEKNIINGTKNTTNSKTDHATGVNEPALDASTSQPQKEAEILLDVPPNPEKPSDATQLTTADATAAGEIVPELEAEILSTLGGPDELPKYEDKIHPDFTQIWLPILRRGMPKEQKESLMKDYAILENFKFLRAPTLNPEISAAISDMSRTRDKEIEGYQQQLGLGITAFAMSLTADDKQKKAIEILSDLHHMLTQARIKQIRPDLDKTFLYIIQDLERDEFLFGSKLTEKINALKTIEKEGLHIKKGTATQKTPTTFTLQASSRSHSLENWPGPSHNSEDPPLLATQKNQSPSSNKGTPLQQNNPSTQAKPRAPPHQ